MGAAAKAERRAEEYEARVGMSRSERIRSDISLFEPALLAIRFGSRSPATKTNTKLLEYLPEAKGGPKEAGSRGTTSTGKAPEVIVVDSKGNAIPLKSGETITGSPDGRYVQVRGPDGVETGMKIDGAHNPMTHKDPRALQPHAHVPGITNPDGTPWLGVR